MSDSIPDPVGDVSDAVGKVADASAPLVETTASILKAALVKPAAALGDVVTDRIRIYQWEQRRKAIETAMKKTERRGIPLASVTPDFLIPWLDGVGGVSDPDLNDMWAQLLASAAESKANRRTAFVSVLTQLSPVDVKALLLAGEQGIPLTVGNQDDNAKKLGVSREEIDLARSNLERLGLITNSYISVSHFGAKLLLACTGELPANWQEDVAGGVMMRSQLSERDNEARKAKRKLDAKLLQLDNATRLQ